jgi:serine/threonine protein kinase
MSSSSSTNDRNPVEALADDFLRRQRGGERPTLEEYCRRHPELADDIREVFPVLIRMEDLRSDGPGESTGGVADFTATRLERLGDYRILREVGRGGMGVVYEAEQESLGRRVALKVLPDAALSDAKQVLRFQREARAAARLHHTNIVPVFGVGQDEGHYYYVMQFIAGMGLDSVLDELRRLRRGECEASPPERRALSRSAVSAVEVAQAIITGRFELADGVNGAHQPGTTLANTASARLDKPDAVSRKLDDSSVVSLPGASAESLARSDPDRTFFRSVARIGLQVAEALEYANRQGILHRDVKPSNLLLDPKGNVWVADFGLAKASDTEDITHSGDIIGTVRYMAPERFAGKCDARSDVYALGLTLYELLALRPAFASPDRHELIRRVMSEQPERLRGLVPHVPRDLVTIVEKAIAREPIERYPSAAALAEDLQRFLDDKPIKARRVTPVEQAWRWARRNPAVAALSAGLLVALVVGLVGVTWQWRQAAANLTAAESAKRKAQARFGLAMEAVRAFTTGASEDVMLKEKALESLRKKLLGQSRTFYERLRTSLEGETDRASRAALAEALFDAAGLYGEVDAPEKALEAHREALALRAALVRERPEDKAAQRDLGRSHLALARVLLPRYQLDLANAELGRARGVLRPLTREHPEDGGARLLEAECDGLEGERLYRNDRHEDALELLERSKTLYQRLIEDNPAYTLPTTADGPTEYRRGLATVLHVLGWIFFEEARAEECLRNSEKQQDVYEALASGPFATDADRRNLAQAYHQMLAQRSLGPSGIRVKDVLLRDRGVTICRQLVAKNPLSVTDRITLAYGLSQTNPYTDPGACASCTEALSIVRALSPEQRQTHDAVQAESDSEINLSIYDFESGRPDEARRHARQAVAILERWVRGGSDLSRASRRLLGLAWRQLAYFEMALGHDKEALEAARQVSATLEPSLRANPRLRISAGVMISGLLIEAMVALRRGQPNEASQLADRAAALVENLDTLASFSQEPFFLGAAHAFFYAVGRPAGPGRPADPPRLPVHSDRAIALVREAVRMGYRNAGATAMINLLLGGPPEMKPLLMDQVFPFDPFRPEPSPGNADLPADARGPNP